MQQNALTHQLCQAIVMHTSHIRSLPKPLTRLFNEELIDAFYFQLVDKSEETLRIIAISTEQAKSLELFTRGQSHRKQYRAGHITASEFKNAVHTDVANPSHPLISKFVTQKVLSSRPKVYLLGIRT